MIDQPRAKELLHLGNRRVGAHRGIQDAAVFDITLRLGEKVGVDVVDERLRAGQRRGKNQHRVLLPVAVLAGKLHLDAGPARQNVGRKPCAHKARIILRRIGEQRLVCRRAPLILRGIRSDLRPRQPVMRFVAIGL